MAGERAEGAWRVKDGAVHVYRLFDVAEAIDLAKAEALISAPKSRLRLESAHGPAALEIPRPPVHLALGARSLPFASGARACETSAHLFDYGVVSIVHRLPIPEATPLEALLPFAEELLAAPTPALDATSRREAEDLVGTLRPALDRPHAWEGHETYHVWMVRAFDRPATAEELLGTAPLAELLLGETSATPLSRAEREDVLKHSFSYLQDDLAVVDWNSAFVHEPSGVPDIPDLLEFATAHLLELRYYDALLDRELQRIYGEIEARGLGPRPNPFTRRYLRLQRHTAALLLELSEMIERLDNAVKIIGDFYLARLYQSTVRRFRLPAWEENVLRKQRLLSEVNGLLSHAADTRRGEMLELTIIALILWEILYAFLRR
jgi:hypothetical protein